MRSIEYASPICCCAICRVAYAVGKFNRDGSRVMQISLQDIQMVKIDDRHLHYRIFPRNRCRCQVLFSNVSANDLNLCWQVLFLQKMCERRSSLTRQPKKGSSKLKSHWCVEQKKTHLLRFLNKPFYLLLNRSECNLNNLMNFPCFSFGFSKPKCNPWL